MFDKTIHHASRMALFASIAAAALLAGAGSDQAWAAKADPLFDAERTGQRSPALRSSRSAALNYSRGRQTRAVSRAVSGKYKTVRGIKITPASASTKVVGLNRRLVRLLAQVQLHYGRPLRIISGCRSKAHNRRVNGAKRSQHLRCKAADFQVPGISKYKLAAYLKRLPGRGGVGTYCRSGFVHLDVGPKRQWHWKCGKRRTARKSARRKSRTSSNR